MSCIVPIDTLISPLAYRTTTLCNGSGICCIQPQRYRGAEIGRCPCTRRDGGTYANRTYRYTDRWQGIADGSGRGTGSTGCRTAAGIGIVDGHRLAARSEPFQGHRVAGSAHVAGSDGIVCVLHAGYCPRIVALASLCGIGHVGIGTSVRTGLRREGHRGSGIHRYNCIG